MTVHYYISKNMISMISITEGRKGVRRRHFVTTGHVYCGHRKKGNYVNQ
jgi:hypothetical protein